MRREGLAVLSGVLLFFSFPKFGHGAVAWVALVPLLVALSGTSGWAAARLGYVTGAVSALGILYWTALVVIQYGGLPLAAGIAVMAALCLAVALFPLLFGWATARLVSTFGPAGLLGAPFIWVATELLRAHTFFEFPWCLLGYSQHAFLPVIQVASAAAVYGVSFILVLFSALLACAVLAKTPPRQRAALVAAALVAGVTWTGGAWAMRRPVLETGRIDVGLVQGGIRQEEKWLPENAGDNVGRHLELTAEAVRRGAKLVVWPESAVPFLYDRDAGLAALLQRTVRSERISLFFGNDDLDAATGRIYVGAKLLSPEGILVSRYRKIHLVPFGEYVPLQRVFTFGGRFAAKLVQEVSDFTPGTEAATGFVDGHRIGGYICYEAIFPALVRRFPAGGAELLVNITNDAWYGTTSAPYQHLAMAAFRAVENRRYMVRAANTGITAVVDPWGRVLDKTRLFDRTALVREVPFVAGTTFYTRHGDVFAYACFAIALAFVTASFRLGSSARWSGRAGR